MIILGIETSCDESAVAIIDDHKNILANVIYSQIDLHKIYGGVIPELSARSHLEVIDKLILQALSQAKLKFSDIDAFCATYGPGLIGGLIVGLTCAKALSAINQKPFLAINHLEGHALTVRLTDNIEFPFLLLLVSGGHSQILITKDLGSYIKIGETIDDSFGEAFDKVAQMLGLEYPGGPKIEKLAMNGDELKYKFPRPLIDSKNHDHLFDFSLSGLKTAVKREIEKITGESFHVNSHQKISEKIKADICASFQFTIVEILMNRLKNVIELNSEIKNLPIKNLVIAGGVSANQYIVAKLQNFAHKYCLNLVSPPLKLCTDNAVMIAYVGLEKMLRKEFDSLITTPASRIS
ncbi:MAG: tRNA (adenosine(37)-N6)-threonylcarbamoyltransferase complex transferase subunit TsaD [Rickettsiales bacterium]